MEQSPIPHQVLNTSKLEQLGWAGQYTLEEGIGHTLEILHSVHDTE